MEKTEKQGPSLLARAIAVLVLVVAGLVLLKLIVGFLAGFFWLIAVVVALIAVIWAYRTLTR
jgi:hypothetical protein